MFDKVKSANGMPISEYLKNDAKIKETILTNKDFGKFAEIIGKRITWNFNKSGILKDVFPDIEIISAKRRYLGVGDIGYVVSYKESEDSPSDWRQPRALCEVASATVAQYKQKVVIFEIKHGRILIGKYQFEKYCRILVDPKTYFPKADEVKIVFMMFNDIDTNNKTASYCLKELDVDVAQKYLDSENKIKNNEVVKEDILDKDLKMLISVKY